MTHFLIPPSYFKTTQKLFLEDGRCSESTNHADEALKSLKKYNHIFDGFNTKRIDIN
jgi:hypothetical protein